MNFKIFRVFRVFRGFKIPNSSFLIPNYSAILPPMCIFCEIVAGRIPCSKVYEDDTSIVFLDIHPIERGHALVVLKRHAPTLLDARPEELEKVIGIVQKVSRAMVDCGLGEGFNVLQNNGKVAGQEVPHLHFHVIPRTSTSDPRNWKSGAAVYVSAEERDAVASQIRSALGQGDAP